MKRILSIPVLVAYVAVALSLRAAQPCRVAILGDSYSTFEGYVQPDTNYVWYFLDENKPERTDVNKPEHTWWAQFTASDDYQLVVNNSFSGATICNTGYGGQDYADRSFLVRAPLLGEPDAFDLILVFGATNDLWAKVPLETSPRGEMYAYRPALRRMLQQMKQRYAKAEIVFMLNDEINGAVRQITLDECRDAHVPVLELHAIDKRQGHPSRAGMTEINRQLTQFVSKQ